MPPRTHPNYTPLQNEAPVAKPKGPPIFLLPTDLLPKRATLDPRFNEQKSLHASSQNLDLAREFGVVRNGIIVSPADLASPPKKDPPAKEVPKKETDPEQVARLEAPTSFFEIPLTPPPDEPAEEKSAPGGPSIVVPSATDTPEEKEKYSDEPPMMGPADLLAIREAVAESVFNSPEQRAIIESRLKGKFSFTDYIFDRPCRQTVVIRPKEFEITYEVLPGKLELMLKEMISAEAASVVLPDYLMDKLHLLGVAASVVAINGNTLPGYRDEAGKIDRRMLLAKFEWLINKPMPLISLLSVHYIWFCDRANRLLQATDPKAG